MDVDDNFPAAKRIIAEIQCIVNSDPNLKEFDLVIQPESQNKSPVIYIDHCLGLESWCVRHVYEYVYQRLVSARKRLKRQVSNETITLLTSALLLNPEVLTFWNMRRELILDGYLKPDDELQFSAVVLTFKPKCAEIFTYRRWIFFNILKDFSSKDIVLNELAVGLTAAAGYASNYNAWNHCFWFIQKSIEHENFSLISHQWEKTKIWCREHISDHSCMQYRQRLLKCLVADKRCLQHLECITSKSLLRFFNSDERHKLMRPSEDNFGEAIGVALDELYFNEELIVMYESHESLWNHRRFLCYLLVNIYKIDCIKEALMNNERRVSTKLLNSNELYVKKHVLWLQTALCIPIKLH